MAWVRHQRRRGQEVRVHASLALRVPCCVWLKDSRLTITGTYNTTQPPAPHGYDASLGEGSNGRGYNMRMHRGTSLYSRQHMHQYPICPRGFFWYSS